MANEHTQTDCSICGKVFSEQKTLLRHMDLHKERFKCKDCGKRFQTNWELRRHENWHIEGTSKFDCKQCDKHFDNKRLLDQHLESWEHELKNRMKDYKLGGSVVTA